jgi:hypothetical protein
LPGGPVVTNDRAQGSPEDAAPEKDGVSIFDSKAISRPYRWFT